MFCSFAKDIGTCHTVFFSQLLNADTVSHPPITYLNGKTNIKIIAILAGCRIMFLYAFPCKIGALQPSTY